jgi:hypothetical protein
MARRIAVVAVPVTLLAAVVATWGAHAATAATPVKCRLRLASPAQVGGAAGTGVMSFTPVDRGNATCKVREIPLVEVLGRTRKVLPPTSSPGFSLPARTAFAVEPGRSAKFVATYVDHPDPIPARDCARAWFLAVLLPPHYVRPLATLPLAISTEVCGDAVPHIYVWPRADWPPQ